MELKIKRQSSKLYEHNRSRICMLTQRNFRKLITRCSDYEFEDVICGVDDVDLLVTEPYPWFSIGQRNIDRLGRNITPAFTFLNPGLRRKALTENYDVFFVICMFVNDLLSLNAIKGWRERCRTAICWLDEIFVSELPKYKSLMRILSKFDYVITGCSGSVRPVQNAIQRPCFYMPPGIDTIRFCPYPNPPIRSIDVYSIGRRSSVTHNSLLAMAEKQQIFYIYDTINSGQIDKVDHRQHRSLIANIAKRSRYFIVNTAKINLPSETNGQSEIGLRFFEGAASGTVMIGESPKNKAFREHFDWPDAVIHVPFDSHHIQEILRDLDAQPKRLEEIRRNNVVQSLLRHDWVHRWKEILDMVGLEPKPALARREKRLKELVSVVRNTREHLP